MLLLLGLFGGLRIVDDTGAGGGSGGESETPAGDDPATGDPAENPELDEARIEKGIIADEARLNILTEDYNNMADSIHDDFEKVLETDPSALFDEEQLELLASDSNIAAKNKMLRDRFESFRDEKLATKKKELDEFGSELKKQKDGFEILSQSNKFAKENPEVDMEALAEFIQEDLPPRKQKEIREKATTKLEFLTLAYEEYKKANPTGDDEDEFPTDLSGVNGATGDASFSDEDEKKAYLKSIGIGRD